MTPPHPLEHVINVVHQADQFKQRQLVAMWPELADALACLIEGTTEHDAPREWHAQPRAPMYGHSRAPARALRLDTPG